MTRFRGRYKHIMQGCEGKGRGKWRYMQHCMHENTHFENILLFVFTRGLNHTTLKTSLSIGYQCSCALPSQRLLQTIFLWLLTLQLWIIEISTPIGSNNHTQPYSQTYYKHSLHITPSLLGHHEAQAPTPYLPPPTQGTWRFAQKKLTHLSNMCAVSLSQNDFFEEIKRIVVTSWGRWS